MQVPLVVVVHLLASNTLNLIYMKSRLLCRLFLFLLNCFGGVVDIGERLLTIRRNKGLSQRDLAKRAGVTNSAISMIETNRVSPSVSSLEKILAGMGMSLTEFFSIKQKDKLDYQVVYRSDELLDVSLDEVTTKLVGKHFLKERSMGLTLQTYPVASRAEVKATSQISEKAGYVIKGEMTLEIQGEVHPLVAGDSFYFESHFAHRFINQGRGEALLLSVQTVTDVE